MPLIKEKNELEYDFHEVVGYFDVTLCRVFVNMIRVVFLNLQDWRLKGRNTLSNLTQFRAWKNCMSYEFSS